MLVVPSVEGPAAFAPQILSGCTEKGTSGPRWESKTGPLSLKKAGQAK